MFSVEKDAIDGIPGRASKGAGACKWDSTRWAWRAPARLNLPAWVQSVLICMHATLDDAFDFEMYIEYDGQRKWYKPVYTMLEGALGAGRRGVTLLRATRHAT